MALTLVGYATNTTGSSIAVALSQAVAANESLVLVAANNDKRALSSITGGWTSRRGLESVAVWDMLTHAGFASGASFTLTFGGSAGKSVWIFKYSGQATFINTNGTTGNSSSPTTNRATTAGNDLFGIIASENSGGLTPPSGFTEIDEDQVGNYRLGSYTYENVPGGTITFNPGTSGGQDYGIALAEYTPPAGGGSTDGNASGSTLTAAASLVAGSASGVRSPTATGATLTSVASLLAGTASGSSALDGNASGAVLTAAASLLAGSASAVRNAEASGAVVSASASLIAGAATGTEIHRYIVPGGTGAGTSWADGADISSINTRIAEAGAGGFVHIRANAGDVYSRTSALGLSAGGASGNPVTIDFVQDDGSAPDATAWLQGNRTTWTHDPDESVVTDTSAWTAGINFFALNTGASHIKFKNCRWRHVGRAVYSAQANSGITLENPYVYNCRQLWSHGSTVAPSGIVITTPNALGFSSKLIEMTGASADLTVTGPGVLDSHRQDGDSGIPRGIAISSSGNGFVIDGLATDGLEIKNCHYTGTAYWNGDGISTEEAATGVVIRDVWSHGHTDGGFDFKHPQASSTLENLRANDNKINFRLWNEDYVLDAPVSQTPTKRGGGGPDFPAHFGLYSNAAVPNATVNQATVTEASTGVLVNASDVTGASIHFQDWVAIPSGIDQLEENGTATGTTVTFDPALGTNGDASGATLTAATSLIAGTASGEIAGSATGAILSSAASLLPGSASGVRNAEATGAVLPVSASLVAGTASGIQSGSAAGQTLAVAATLLAGTASGEVNGAATGATVSASASLVAGTASGQRNATASGATLTAAASLVAGTAQGASGSTGLGATLTAQASLIAGTAMGQRSQTASGAVLSAAASLVPGTASAGQAGAAGGATLNASASLIAGTASVSVVAGGAVLEAVASLLPANATADRDAEASGALLVASASLIAGTATGVDINARFPTAYRGFGQSASVDRRNTASGSSRMNRQPSYVRRM